MKKIVIFLLSALLCMTLPVCGAAESITLDSLTVGNTMLSVTVTTAESGMLLLCVYDAAGQLLSYNTAPTGTGVVLSAALPTEAESGTCKILLWDGLRTMRVRGARIARSWSRGTAFLFTNTSITPFGSGSGYTISGTALTISAAGTYTLSGSCADGSVTVAKDAGAVTLLLNGLDLTATTTAPLVTKGGTTAVTITAADGTDNTLRDTDRAGAKPKSAINAAQGIVIDGGGSLTLYGNNKNGIKSDTNVTVRNLTLTVTAADNGIAADNLLNIESGTVSVTSAGDALKAAPDEITAEYGGNIIINGGDITLRSAYDGVQADGALTIFGGTFDIKTGKGHAVPPTDDSSLKGLKAADTLTVYGGDFTFDTADDAVHSNTYVYILGGTYDIATGDDGFHADTSLIIGTASGADTDCDIDITSAYEGLEAGTVYLYSGTMRVRASNDGLNAAGGSDGDTGNDTFNPGGGGGTGPGKRPSGGTPTVPTTSTENYGIHIEGGNLYVNADGDGLDANGGITMTGGTVTVFGAANNGNGALDYDSTFAMTGGTVLAVGYSGMAQSVTSNISTINAVSLTGTIAAGNILRIKDANGTVLRSATAVKSANHVVYAAPTIEKNAQYTLEIER